MGMRLLVILASAAALLPVPANAATFLLSGTVTGTARGIVACEAGMCPSETPYTDTFSFYVDLPLLPDLSTYSFPYTGPSANAGGYEGSFRSIGNGQYEGISITYSRASGSCSVGNLMCSVDAGAREFSVLQVSPPPVPEPMTWMLMLLGFGAIGGAMRHRIKPTQTACHSRSMPSRNPTTR